MAEHRSKRRKGLGGTPRSHAGDARNSLIEFRRQVPAVMKAKTCSGALWTFQHAVQFAQAYATSRGSAATKASGRSRPLPSQSRAVWNKLGKLRQHVEDVCGE